LNIFFFVSIVKMQSAVEDYKEFIEYISQQERRSPEILNRSLGMQAQFEAKCQNFIANNSAKRMKRDFPGNGGRVYAIGDIHADYCTFLVCLKLARVIPEYFSRYELPENCRWTGGESIVVQVGDLIGGECPSCDCDYRKKEERYESECVSFLNIVKLIDVLNRQAPSGAGIITLFGNHEIRNLLAYNESIMTPTMKHLHINEMEEGKKLSGSHRNIFLPGGLMSNYLGCASEPILMIGDWLFVHGGVTSRFLDNPLFSGISDDQRKLTFYNMLVKDYVLSEDKETYYFLTPGDKERYFESMVEEASQDRTTIISPLWNNAYGVKLLKKCSHIDYPLERIRMNHMVIGHVPQFKKKINEDELAKPKRHHRYGSAIGSETIINACETKRGTVFRTDVSMSYRGCKHRAQIMEISADGSVAYIANRASNRRDPDIIDRYEEEIF